MIMATTKADRREYERFPIKQSSVDYGSSGLLASLGKKKQAKDNILVNMGRGGAQFTSPTHVMPGTKIAASIHIPAFINNLNLTARVVWCKKFPKTKSYRVGVAFVKANKKTWRNIDTLRRDVFFRSQGQSKIIGSKRA